MNPDVEGWGALGTIVMLVIGLLIIAWTIKALRVQFTLIGLFLLIAASFFVGMFMEAYLNGNKEQVLLGIGLVLMGNRLDRLPALEDGKEGREAQGREAMRRRLPFLVAILLALAVLCAPMVTVSAGSCHQVWASGTHITINGTASRIVAVDDQTVVIYQMYPYPTYHYRGSNHLFSSAGGGYTGDPSTLITASNFTDFWWKYFWEVRHLGLNGDRLGGFDVWALSMLHSVWHLNQTLWHSVIDPMFNMANETGTYLCFCFGGDAYGTARFSKTSYTFGPGVANPTSGSIYQIGSETYEEFVSFMGAVMQNYTNRTSLAFWEALNEPDGDAAYNNYWLPVYGSPAAAKTAFISWSQNLSADLIAEDHHHLIINGVSGGLFFGWGQANFNGKNAGSWDCVGAHAYGSAQDEYLVHDPKSWATALGKPFFEGEVGLSDSAPPWGIYYWPWYNGMAATYDISLCWMTLWNYPGYPPSASDMSAIPGIPASYWANMSSAPATPVVIPPAPDPLPDPHPEPPVHDDTLPRASSPTHHGGGDSSGGGGGTVATGGLSTRSKVAIGGAAAIGAMAIVLLAVAHGSRKGPRRREKK